MNKFFTKKRSKSIMIWICILFLIYLYIKPHIVSTYETHILTELKVVDNGEINLIAENEYSSLEIKDLIPKEYQDYDYISTPDILAGDTMYFFTQRVDESLDNFAHDLFSFNFLTAELCHIADFSNEYFVELETYIVDENYYTYGYVTNTKDPLKSNQAYLIKDNELISLSNTVYLGAVAYEDGIAISELSTDGTYISKYNGTKKNSVIFLPFEASPTYYITGKTLAWISSEYTDSGKLIYFNTYINNELNKSIFNGMFLMPFKHFYISHNTIETPETDILSIMNYNREEITNIQGQDLDIYSSNFDDTFIYKDKISGQFYKVYVDAKNNTMYTTELLFSYDSDHIISWILDGNNMLIVTNDNYGVRNDENIEYLFFTEY